MRRTWIVTICLMFATAEAATKPTSVRIPAAEKQEEEKAEGQEGAEDDQDADQSEVSERPVRPSTSASPNAEAPNEVHSVVKGDTLWDLSQRYLGSPWYWPKVWSYNPEIANPHWIYPGNRVRFFSGGDEAPSEVEVASEPGARSSDDMEQTRSPDSIDLDHEPDVRVSGKIGYRPTRGVRLSHQGFLTAKQLEQAGFIASSFAETLMFSYPDHVYVKFPRGAAVKVGERYLVFRTAAEIIHPVTHRKVGYLTHVLGTVRVTQLSKDVVTAQVNPDTWDEVHRGDLIGAAGEQLNEAIERRANDHELKGYVIGALVPYLTALGEHNVIIIDKGRSDGVQRGQTFTVVRQQDPISPEAFLNPARERDPRLPVEDVGTCMAIDVKDVATMCLLTRSLREIVHGDRVEMRPETAKEQRAALR